MTAPASNFLLNTENYEPVFTIAKQITTRIQENEKILARIANVVDSKIKYPQLPNGEKSTDHEVGELEKTTSKPDSVIETGDPLRILLDQKFKANDIEDVHQFDNIENPELRQLLCDNYKLLQMKKANAEKNKNLLEISHEYENLLLEAIIPTLAKDSSDRNLQNLSRIKSEEVEQKLLAQQDLWNTYQRYLISVDKSGRLVEELIEVLENSLDSKEAERLALQMIILETFKNQRSLKHLRRVR
ncbi:CIC11C00000004819 [Sungouiella intermedia]|uniref:CIC11C00000004819 n=1 Tax=Sungouiella intermedia TaxID=45354 RepID=A0A1L0DP87_9ASCO|nr:CIC11C00000004819 [[Candida] intermedia]